MISLLQIIFLFSIAAKISNSESLPKFNVNIKETSVSGLSSGAFFATQIQIAFSSTIKGAGIIAGGPYDCGGLTLYAMCMYLSAPSVSQSIERTNEWSGDSIDDKSNLNHQKVFMISGSKDQTVSTSVMDQLYKYYVTDSHYIPAQNVVYKKDLTSGHTFPTDFDSTGNSECSTSESPFISNCGFDSAGAILQHIYGDLKPKNSTKSTGSFVKFDQSEFISYPNIYGLDDNGYLYVPKACADGQECRLHIAFHGCLQSVSVIGESFVRNTGYDLWADTNNLLILFPQTVATITPRLSPTNFWVNNLNGCWDWIGFYDFDFATKSGLQMNFIKKLMQRIGK